MDRKKKIGVGLLAGGILFFLFSRRSKAATVSTQDEERDPAPPSPEQDEGLTPDLCANNARRRDMTHFHDRRDELVPVESHGSQESLHPEAAEAYNRLLRAARAAGFEAPLFAVVSGYRSRASQERLWASQISKQRVRHPDWSQAEIEREAAKWVARPGHSDHETGCAVDFWLGYGISSANNEAIRATAAYAWLARNAWRFGFCEYAFKSPSSPGEGWHWKHILRSVRMGA